jgi:hypothetical protein
MSPFPRRPKGSDPGSAGATRRTTGAVGGTLGATALLALLLAAPLAPAGRDPALRSSPPSDECAEAGFERNAWGLCRVYCSVLDCDSDAPSASERACVRIAELFASRTDGAPLPCEAEPVADADGDGVPDGEDSCPDEPNPLQEDTFGEPDVGDACDCPCFTRGEVQSLTSRLADISTYRALACLDKRPGLPVTSVTALRVDGATCGSRAETCGALAKEFTKDQHVCQLHPPAPETATLDDGLSHAQLAACRSYVVDGAAAAGVACD